MDLNKKIPEWTEKDKKELLDFVMNYYKLIEDYVEDVSAAGSRITGHHFEFSDIDVVIWLKDFPYWPVLRNNQSIMFKDYPVRIDIKVKDYRQIHGPNWRDFNLDKYSLITGKYYKGKDQVRYLKQKYGEDVKISD